MRNWLMVAALALAGGGPGIGLSVDLDRAAPVYAIGDTIALNVSVEHDAGVRVWLRDPAGHLTPVIPATPDGAPIHVRAGEQARLPRRGGFRITPPPGRYEFLVTATGEVSPDRSLLDAGSRLAGQDRREQRTIVFTVERI